MNINIKILRFQTRAILPYHSAEHFDVDPDVAEERKGGKMDHQTALSKLLEQRCKKIRESVRPVLDRQLVDGRHNSCKVSTKNCRKKLCKELLHERKLRKWINREGSDDRWRFRGHCRA